MDPGNARYKRNNYSLKNKFKRPELLSPLHPPYLFNLCNFPELEEYTIKLYAISSFFTEYFGTFVRRFYWGIRAKFLVPSIVKCLCFVALASCTLAPVFSAVSRDYRESKQRYLGTCTLKTCATNFRRCRCLVKIAFFFRQCRRKNVHSCILTRLYSGALTYPWLRSKFAYSCSFQ